MIFKAGDKVEIVTKSLPCFSTCHVGALCPISGQMEKICEVVSKQEGAENNYNLIYKGVEVYCSFHESHLEKVKEIKWIRMK